MEFFRTPNFDFLRWKWHALALSLAVIGAGAASLVLKGGPRLGVDFKGGTVVYVKFAEPPSLDRLRASLAERGLASSTIQEYGPAANHEFVISLEQQGADEEALEAGRRSILESLRATLNVPESKIDFNHLGADSLATRLEELDPIALSGKPAEAQTRYREIARAITSFRDTQRRGLVRSFAELRDLESVPPAVVMALEREATLAPFVVRKMEIVGPKVGEDLRRQAVIVTLLALAGILVYIALRFRQWAYGVGAVVAVFHDVLVAIGALSLGNYEFNLNVLAAILTLAGYSVNDTIVIFDRIRENAQLLKRESFTALVNRSLNQTLSRTVLTSGLTFLTVVALYSLGGEVLHGFAFTLLVGMISGTYSTLYVASPIVVGWVERAQAAGGTVRARAEKGPGPAPAEKAALAGGRKGR